MTPEDLFAPYTSKKVVESIDSDLRKCIVDDEYYYEYEMMQCPTTKNWFALHNKERYLEMEKELCSAVEFEDLKNRL